MGIAVILGLSGAIAVSQPLLVDFKLDGRALPAVTMPAQTATGSEVGQPEVAPSARQPFRPRVILANGFGHDIPLDFAVRQVVPHYWHIQYGSTVNQQIRVSWQGGKPWEQVLHTVLAPLGLRTRPSGRRLWILE
jgi:hypothetical protein